MTLRRSAVCVALIAGLGLPVRIARANPWELYGFNARALAMANAHTALADDFTAIFYNPGALTARSNPGFGIGYTIAAPQLSFDFAQKDREVEAVEPPRSDGLTFGLRLPLGTPRIALALGLSFPTSSLLSGQALDPVVPHWYMIHALPRRMVGALGLGVRPHQLIGIGVAFQILGGVDGELEYRADPLTGEFFRRSVVFDIKPVAAPIVGLELGEHRGVRLGLTWRGPLETTVDLPLDLELIGVADVALSTLFTVQYNPHQLSAGASLRWPGVNLNLTVDLTWAFWSAAPDPAVDSRIWVSGELVEGPPDAPRSVDLGFSDVLIPRFGIERRVREFAFRAGYSFRPSPAPRQTSGSNYVDGDAHMFTFGTGVELRNPAGLDRDLLSIDIGGAVFWYPSRAHSKSDPDDPVGSFTAGGTTMALAITLRYAIKAAPSKKKKPSRPARPLPGTGDGTWQPRASRVLPPDDVRRVPWLPSPPKRSL